MDYLKTWQEAASAPVLTDLARRLLAEDLRDMHADEFPHLPLDRAAEIMLRRLGVVDWRGNVVDLSAVEHYANCLVAQHRREMAHGKVSRDGTLAVNRTIPAPEQVKE